MPGCDDVRMQTLTGSYIVITKYTFKFQFGGQDVPGGSDSWKTSEPAGNSAYTPTQPLNVGHPTGF